ncbi:MAG: DUF1778 domain-containing protein [Planctomycetota bacterium]|nr:MAG: DUF1778 domain-containing protein [Planctomycetota bacterium]
MTSETRTTDAKGRLVLPKGFANVTVIVEQVSDCEIRVRRAKVVAEDDLPFAEETAVPLSDRDRDRFLELLANPQAPPPALKAAAARHRARRD